MIVSIRESIKLVLSDLDVLDEIVDAEDVVTPVWIGLTVSSLIIVRRVFIQFEALVSGSIRMEA